MKSLSILTWNANGLVPNRNEIQILLELNNIDLCLISETHCTQETYCNIRGYKFYHTIHPSNNARGGSGVFVKEQIKHYENIKIQTDKIQLASVTLQTQQYPVTIASIYCPPSRNPSYEDWIQVFSELGNTFIIGGDFNAKHTHWGSRLISPRGNTLFKAIIDKKVEALSTGTPTHWPTDPQKIPDLIDFFLVKNLSSNYITLAGNNDVSSNHSAVILTLSENIILKPNNPVLVNKKTDWTSFKITLSKRIDLTTNIQTEEDIDIELSKFVDDIQACAWDNTPEIKRKLQGINYPQEIINLVREKRRARTKWHQTRAPSDKTRFNQLVKKLKNEIKIIKMETMNNFLSNLSYNKNEDYSLWKSTKYFKRPTVQAPPLRNMGGGWVKDNQSKADVFAEYLAGIFTPNEASPEIEPLDEISFKESDYNIPYASTREVKNTIKHEINPKKAPGYDLITGQVLQNLPRKAVVKITKIINAVFRLQYVPQLWKIAEVIMIPKPGKPLDQPTSYRPISLLPVLSKLFEKILLKRIMSVIEEKKIIPNHQFGFRHKHSTIEQVHRIISVIEEALEGKKVCSAIFLDVTQAFDRVWHEGLIFKLKNMFPEVLAKILISYISFRFFRIKQDDCFSKIMEIKAGVPQGSVLGPVLYVLFTSDLPADSSNTTATFADDTAFLSVGKNTNESIPKLQQSISRMQSWTKKWRIKLNEGKSVHVDFTNKNAPYIPTFLNDKIIPFANEAKYLGMNLDAKLRWKVHVKKKREQLSIKARKMYWLMGKHSNLPVECKLMLYKQVLRPIWTYGIQLWGCTKPSNVLIIQRFQNQILRSIVGAPKYIQNVNLHRDLGVESVNEMIHKAAAAHHQKLEDHINIEAVQLLDVSDHVRRLKRIKPYELLK